MTESAKLTIENLILSGVWDIALLLDTIEELETLGEIGGKNE